MGEALQRSAQLATTLSRTDDAAPEAPSSGKRRRHVPGDLLAGKYQLIRRLDEGGMGVIWVAHNRDLDAQVALKMLRSEGGSPDAAERLLVEARAAARLDHPAIVRIFDVERTAAGHPFLVMELLEGEVLADTLARERRIDPITAIRTLLPIVGALGAMHERGMIHRDVKPENIFLVPAGSNLWRPKLIDLGLARLGVADRITQQGVVIGTPGYMAPEQLRGDEVDSRADLWAFCAVLYRTIAGVLPFDGATPIELFKAMIANQPRPLAELGCGDAELDAILERGFAKPALRWQSARELGKALAAWLWDQGVTEDISGAALRATWLDDADVRSLALSSRTPTARYPTPLPPGEIEAGAGTSGEVTIAFTAPPPPSMKPWLGLLALTVLVLAVAAALQADGPTMAHIQAASPPPPSPEPPALDTAAAYRPAAVVEAPAREPALPTAHTKAQPPPPPRPAPRLAPPPRPAPAPQPSGGEVPQGDLKDPYP